MLAITWFRAIDVDLQRLCCVASGCFVQPHSSCPCIHGRKPSACVCVCVCGFEEPPKLSIGPATACVRRPVRRSISFQLQWDLLFFSESCILSSMFLFQQHSHFWIPFWGFSYMSLACHSSLAGKMKFSHWQMPCCAQLSCVAFGWRITPDSWPFSSQPHGLYTPPLCKPPYAHPTISESGSYLLTWTSRYSRFYPKPTLTWFHMSKCHNHWYGEYQLGFLVLIISFSARPRIWNFVKMYSCDLKRHTRWLHKHNCESNINMVECQLLKFGFPLNFLLKR